MSKVEWLLDPVGKPPAPSGARKVVHLRDGIRFDNVEFQFPSHPDAAPTLKGVSFEIVAGKSTALIGPSGSGKTTIVNLICRLIDPSKGVILLDGQPLTDFDPASWRSMISLSGQDADLIGGTVAENISYGMPGLANSEILDAAQLADADGFIRSLPKGYATAVATRALNLSGGQRQRIGLARALARKPDLLILDEATNAVDGLSESSIMKLIQQCGRRMTLLVISHRPSTLAVCQNGIVIEDGRIKECGPLPELALFRQMNGVDTVRSPSATPEFADAPAPYSAQSPR